MYLIIVNKILRIYAYSFVVTNVRCDCISSDCTSWT